MLFVIFVRSYNNRSNATVQATYPAPATRALREANRKRDSRPASATAGTLAGTAPLPRPLPTPSPMPPCIRAITPHKECKKSRSASPQSRVSSASDLHTEDHCAEADSPFLRHKSSATGLKMTVLVAKRESLHRQSYLQDTMNCC